MNYTQYLEDYWPKEESNDNTEQFEQYDQCYGRVTNIDRQIAELEARKDALQHGYCFIGVPPKTYVDPYNLDGRFINS